VEDNKGIANLERRHLEKEGFRVAIAETGEQGLDFIANGDAPDLLIIDYVLPDMSGVDLMRRLKAKGKAIPSIIVTAAGNEQVAVSAMKLGAMDYIVKDKETIRQLPSTCREVLRNANLEGENVRLIEELKRVNARLVEANRRLDELSKKDDLTGIYNRRYLMESLDYEVTRSRRYLTPLCLAIFDIDRFKEVNDTYGHTAGDHVLRQFATLLKDRLRKTDILGRYGGEEFALVLTETDVESAVSLCEEIREAVSLHPFGYEHSPIRMTASAGVGFMVENMDRRELIEAADKSLYMAKDAGRDGVAAMQMIR
jgi:diguanylate cyclase (GGDEF)-like protein